MMIAQSPAFDNLQKLTDMEIATRKSEIGENRGRLLTPEVFVPPVKRQDLPPCPVLGLHKMSISNSSEIVPAARHTSCVSVIGPRSI